MSRRCSLPLVFALYASAAAATAATPATRFDDATRYDLEGKPQLAFATYLSAAEAGLPEAEFNVAVMLDSGRGVRSDLTQAAVWYARAASHGFSRAAYDLGQLYESGQGVPRNGELAQAWFEASKLPAARDRLKGRRLMFDGRRQPTPPDLVAPAADGKITPENAGVELVWTSPEQPGPTQYYVELRAVDKSASREIFSAVTRVSSVSVDLPGAGNNYAWRVSVLLKESGQYLNSGWRMFDK